MALVLDRTKLAESDLILTMLTEDGVLRRAVAKGGRRPGNRFAAASELYGKVDVVLAPGRSLYTVADARRVFPPKPMGGDLVVLSAAAAMAETLRYSLAEGESDPYAYAMTERAFEEVAIAHDVAHVRLLAAAYGMKLLSHLGWQPALALCVTCGKGDPSFFNVEAGGVVCGDCVGDRLDSFPLSAREYDWLRALLALRLHDLAKATIDDATAYDLARLTRDWAAYHLEIALRAFDLLLSL